MRTCFVAIVFLFIPCAALAASGASGRTPEQWKLEWGLTTNQAQQIIARVKANMIPDEEAFEEMAKVKNLLDQGLTSFTQLGITQEEFVRLWILIGMKTMVVALGEGGSPFWQNLMALEFMETSINERPELTWEVFGYTKAELHHIAVKGGYRWLANHILFPPDGTTPETIIIWCENMLQGIDMGEITWEKIGWSEEELFWQLGVAQAKQ